MNKELKELIGILNYKEWGFRMYEKMSTHEYVIGVILGNGELECNVYDRVGLKALMFDVVNFDRDAYDSNNITDKFEEFLNICINKRIEVKIISDDDFYYTYNFECKDCWVIKIAIENDVYIVPYKNKELITLLISKLASPYKLYVEYNGSRIIADSEFNTLRFKVEFGGKFIVFDNFEYAKKFIDNNMKGE